MAAISVVDRSSVYEKWKQAHAVPHRRRRGCSCWGSSAPASASRATASSATASSSRPRVSAGSPAGRAGGERPQGAAGGHLPQLQGGARSHRRGAHRPRSTRRSARSGASPSSTCSAATPPRSSRTPPRCQSTREDMELLGSKNVEVIKAFAGSALARRQADEALAELKDAANREANAGDVEMAFLLAEAQALKRQEKQAIATLEQGAQGQQGLGQGASHAGQPAPGRRPRRRRRQGLRGGARRPTPSTSSPRWSWPRWSCCCARAMPPRAWRPWRRRWMRRPWRTWAPRRSPAPRASRAWRSPPVQVQGGRGGAEGRAARRTQESIFIKAQLAQRAARQP